MKRRQVRKSAIRKRLNKENTLEKDTIKLIKKANSRLDALSRRFRSGTWASKKLMNRLSNKKKMNFWSKKNRIKIPKNATKTQLIGINKAINQFLSSKTSTVKGINDIRNKQIESIQTKRSIERSDFTYQDAETLYELFGDNDFNYFADKIGASTLQELIMDAIDNGDSEDDFVIRLGLYLEINDADMRDRVVRLYNKFV